MSVDEKQAKKAALIAQCKSKEGATDADAQIFQAHEVPTTKTAKCLGACIMETIGVVRQSIFFL